MTLDWTQVCDRLRQRSRERTLWRYGQEDTLAFVADRLQVQPGVLVADEVGLGKTRVALAVVEAVIEQGGTAGVVVPPGFLYQWREEWREFRKATGRGSTASAANQPVLLRSYAALLEAPRLGKCPSCGRPHLPRLDDPARSFPLAQRGTWVLMSSTLGTPQLKGNSLPVRFRLPALAAARHFDKLREHRNTSLWQFARDELSDCWLGGCDGCQDYSDGGCSRVMQELKAAEFLASCEELHGLFAEFDRNAGTKRAAAAGYLRLSITYQPRMADFGRAV
jgi:hypothetical protein